MAIEEFADLVLSLLAKKRAHAVRDADVPLSARTSGDSHLELGRPGMMETRTFKLGSKAPHVLWALTILAIGAICVISLPDLVKDSTATFGTIGLFLSLYALIFAIVEVRRAKDASTLASNAATQTLARVNSLYSERDIAECQKVIESAMSSMDDSQRVPSRVLLDIVKVYSRSFPSEMDSETSDHRRNRSVIQAYAFMGGRRAIESEMKATRAALYSIAGHFAQVQGHRSQQGLLNDS